MSVLIINYRSKDDTDYSAWLKDLNEDLILLNAEESYDQFSSEDFVYMESFSNYDDESYRYARAVELYHQYKYRNVIAIYEFDILLASLLREKFGLEGQSYKSALDFRNKVLMKQKAQQNGLKTPAFAEIKTVFDLLDFIETYSYPVFVKPIDKAGSVNTTKISNEHDLKKFLQKGIPSNIEVEEFIDGEMYHVDGIVINGELKLISASTLLEGGTSIFAGGHLSGNLLDEKNPLSSRLINYTIKLLESLDTPKTTTFHCELFHTIQDEIVLCEIASRTGGTRINTVNHVAYGVNLNQTLVRAQMCLPVEFPENLVQKTLAGHLLIPPRKGRLLSVPQEEPPSWVVEYIVSAKVGQVYESPKESVESIASFVVVGETEEIVQERIQSSIKWFNENSEWESE